MTKYQVCIFPVLSSWSSGSKCLTPPDFLADCEWHFPSNLRNTLSTTISTVFVYFYVCAGSLTETFTAVSILGGNCAFSGASAWLRLILAPNNIPFVHFSPLKALALDYFNDLSQPFLLFADLFISRHCQIICIHFTAIIWAIFTAPSPLSASLCAKPQLSHWLGLSLHGSGGDTV